MGQWGEVMVIDGLEIVPHVKTNCFERISYDYSEVDDLVLLSNDPGSASASMLLEDLKTQYIGKPYSLWKLARAELLGAGIRNKLRDEIMGDCDA